MSQDIRANVLDLMKQKDKIEGEIKQLTSILSQNGVGMSDPLVDAEGFPKNSIDVYQVRHARHRIICLQNDHKAIMKQIENGLHGYYTSTSQEQQQQSTDVEMNNETNQNQIVVHDRAFARVTVVTAGSPADLADLRQGDEIVEFGSLNTTNFRSINDIANIVQYSENSPINIKLKRGHRFLHVELTPQRWHGKGLLGCGIDSL